MLGVSVLAGFVLVTRALSNGEVSLGWAGTEIFWFLVVFLVVIPIHELGHALAGFLVGYRIRGVVIGVGSPLLAFNVAGVAIRINLLPFGGLTLGTPRGGSWLRLRLWVFALGGPAANVALCYVLRRLYGHADAATAEQHRLAAVASSASWTVLALNLIPFKTAEGASSDGYSLFTIPFWKQAQLEEARIVVEALPLLEALRRDDPQAATLPAEELQARFPEHRLTASLLGSLRHRQGRSIEALSLWRQALARSTHPRQIAFLKNNIAFVEVVIGDPANFAEADAYSAAAMAAHPELTPFVGTRGAVLARLGRAAEALPLLRRAAAVAEPGRSQAYNRASLASALAMLGRTAEARRELDDARRMNSACELLQPAEADLRAAPATPVVLPEVPGALLSGGVWEKWGGLVRWRQIARGLAFLYTLAPLNGLLLGIAPMVVAIVVMLNPEIAGVLTFGVCNLWIAATEHSGVARTALTASSGLIAVALTALRPRLGPSPPSKVPAVLAWILGVVATLSTLALPLTLAMRLHRHGGHAGLGLGLHSLRPSQSAAVTLVGWATVLLIGRRRSARRFAIVPLALALLALSGPRPRPPVTLDLRQIPVDGAAVTWSAPRPASVARTAHFPASDFLTPVVLSPGGRAFFTRFFSEEGLEEGQGKKPRRGIRIRDFEGHLVETDAFVATFVDDERMLLVRPATPERTGLELSEVRPFSSLAPLWSRRIPELDKASVEVEPGGQTIVLTGGARGKDAEIMIRMGFGSDAPRRIVPIQSQQPDADFGVGTFFTSDGEGGRVVSRQRAAGAAADAGRSPFVVGDLRDDESNDLELWAIQPEGERLLAAHLPHPDCLAPTVGRPVLWCPVGWMDDRALLKVDPVAGRVTRVEGALPPRSRAVLLGPSKLVVHPDDDRLGVVDLETRQGTWLRLPPAEKPSAGSRRWETDLAEDGLAIVTNASKGQDATLTVYAPP